MDSVMVFLVIAFVSFVVVVGFIDVRNDISELELKIDTLQESISELTIVTEPKDFAPAESKVLFSDKFCIDLYSGYQDCSFTFKMVEDYDSVIGEWESITQRKRTTPLYAFMDGDSRQIVFTPKTNQAAFFHEITHAICFLEWENLDRKTNHPLCIAKGEHWIH